MKNKHYERRYHHQCYYPDGGVKQVWYRYVLIQTVKQNCIVSAILRTYHDDGRFISEESITLEKMKRLIQQWDDYNYDQKCDPEHDHSIPNGWPRLQKPKNKDVPYILFLAKQLQVLPISAIPGLIIEVDK